MSFTKKQQIAYDALMNGDNLFLSGEAGTGKSYVINSFLSVKRNENILVCAPTGIAAINVGGVTIHRAFKAPLEVITQDEVFSVQEAIIMADTIIIDEISMCRLDLFDYVAKSIKLAIQKRAEMIEAAKKCNENTFEEYFIDKQEWLLWLNKEDANIQVVVVGDFLQLPPVLRDEEKEVLIDFYGRDIKDGFAFLGNEWASMNFKSVLLDEVVRQKDLKFVNALNLARIGNDDCIDFLNEQTNQKKIPGGIILAATNKKVAAINQKELADINAEEFKLYAEEYGDVKDTDRPTEKVLKLKVGARVICLINDKDNQYQNGSVGTVQSISSEGIDVLFDGKSQSVTIEKNRWSIEDAVVEKDENGKKLLVKKEVGVFIQFPFKLAYAITIHKSQGQTYEKVNIDSYCWAPGQLYVALSRATSLKNLHLTRKIKKRFLIASREVILFYNSISDDKNIFEKKSLNYISEENKDVTKKKKTTSKKISTKKIEKEKTVSTERKIENTNSINDYDVLFDDLFAKLKSLY